MGVLTNKAPSHSTQSPTIWPPTRMPSLPRCSCLPDFTSPESPAVALPAHRTSLLRLPADASGSARLRCNSSASSHPQNPHSSPISPQLANAIIDAQENPGSRPSHLPHLHPPPHLCPPLTEYQSVSAPTLHRSMPPKFTTTPRSQ